MRRLWLTFLLALSLITGGVGSAWAASDCPYLKAPTLEQHSCCPDGAMPDDTPAPHDGKTMDCKIGQACRTTPAVTPLLFSQIVPHAAPMPVRIIANDRTATIGPVFSLWRPPRAERA